MARKRKDPYRTMTCANPACARTLVPERVHRATQLLLRPEEDPPHLRPGRRAAERLLHLRSLHRVRLPPGGRDRLGPFRFGKLGAPPDGTVMRRRGRRGQGVKGLGRRHWSRPLPFTFRAPANGPFGNHGLTTRGAWMSSQSRTRSRSSATP
jgi:hypothetical protein